MPTCKEPKVAEQTTGVYNGNEMASMAVAHMDYHIMGYYPITPSTKVPEFLDEMFAAGDHKVRMVPGDGEHGAAGICFGATTAGGRVFNATSANGFLFSIEQYPVQSGSRYPMLLNLINRCVSGPLNIRGDHSDMGFALNTGWLMFCAKDPQRIYDLNIIATKLAEYEDVRLPAMVNYDGFCTSHQKRRVKFFTDRAVAKDFIGPFKVMNSSIDPAHPLTIGPYMNDDVLNNHKQLSLAMEAAYARLPEVLADYAAISGRIIPICEMYKMDDAEVAIFILNSAFDTAKAGVDVLRKKGIKAGALTLNCIRPFPRNEIQAALSNIKALVVADRQESYGARGGNMTLEIKAALKDDPDNATKVASRVYGLGGVELFIEDAAVMLEEALTLAEGGDVPDFEYVGDSEGDPEVVMETAIEPLTEEELKPGIISTERDAETGEIKVKGVNLRKLTAMPDRIVGGHGGCNGCGIFTNLNIFMKGLEGHVVVLFHTGCGMVVTTGYPESAHRSTYVHNLFQSGAATIDGIVNMYQERKRRGEIPSDLDITFLMVSGDGGMDIGQGPLIGAAMRNANCIILEYDNQGYMNTGNQLSFTTPIGMSTSTSHVGPAQAGKRNFHKDTVQIMAGTHIPYLFSAIESNPIDMIKKAAKAQVVAREEGLVYAKVLSNCQLSWRYDPKIGRQLSVAAVDSCFFPLYEIYRGKTTLNYDPEAKGKKVPLADWLSMMGRSKHMLKEENAGLLGQFQGEVDRRWERIKAMNEHPLL